MDILRGSWPRLTLRANGGPDVMPRCRALLAEHMERERDAGTGTAISSIPGGVWEVITTLPA